MYTHIGYTYVTQYTEDGYLYVIHKYTFVVTEVTMAYNLNEKYGVKKHLKISTRNFADSFCREFVLVLYIF